MIKGHTSSVTSADMGDALHPTAAQQTLLEPSDSNRAVVQGWQGMFLCLTILVILSRRVPWEGAPLTQLTNGFS